VGDNLQGVLVTPSASKIVYSDSLVVFPLQTYSSFAILQSRIHEIWAQFFSSSLEDRLRYTPSDCFETFPFPHPHPPAPSPIKGEGEQSDPPLPSVGADEIALRFPQRAFHQAEGLGMRGKSDRTLTSSPSPIEGEGNRNVLPPSPLVGEGLGMRGKSKRKKPYRYRWTEEFHDEVLARLIALNKERHEEELMGMAEVEKNTTKGKKTGAKQKKKSEKKTEKPEPILGNKQLSLIPPDAEQLEL
jgi:hypothetical protein